MCEPVKLGVLQLSVAVGSVQMAIAQVSAVLSKIAWGQLAIIGAVVSVEHIFTGKIVMVNAQVATF
jgi:hypothetical protein